MDRSPNSQTTIDGWPRGLSLNQEYTETHTANALHHMPNIRAVATMVGAVESKVYMRLLDFPHHHGPGCL